MSPSRIILAVAAISLLGACGTRPPERALSGAGLGAAAGVVGTAIIGSSVAAGAAVGAAAGAIIGAVSDPDKINLD